MSLNEFGNREILRFLMNNTHQSFDAVEIKIVATSLPVTINVIAHAFGVPEGSDESLDFAKKQEEQTKIKQSVHQMLKLPANTEKGNVIMDDKKKEHRKNMAIEGKIKVDYLLDVMNDA